MKTFPTVSRPQSVIYFYLIKTWTGPQERVLHCALRRVSFPTVTIGSSVSSVTKGPTRGFKDLLDSEGVLERWYKYEAEASERALRDWCAENDIQLIGGIEDSAAQPVDAPRRLPAGSRPPWNGRLTRALGVKSGESTLSTPKRALEDQGA